MEWRNSKFTLETTYSASCVKWLLRHAAYLMYAFLADVRKIQKPTKHKQFTTAEQVRLQSTLYTFTRKVLGLNTDRLSWVKCSWLFSVISGKSRGISDRPRPLYSKYSKHFLSYMFLRDVLLSISKLVRSHFTIFRLRHVVIVACRKFMCMTWGLLAVA